MNATSLLVSTTRLVLQADARGVGDPSTLSDLYRLVPYLRQSLSCTVCAQLLREPYTPQAPQCQHHVCRNCLGGRKNLKPTCQWCRDYQKYEINTQLRILLQCYRHLCEYIVSKPMYRHVIGGGGVVANASSIGTAAAGTASTSVSHQHNGNGAHSSASNSLLDLIEEGARFKDNYKSNSGQLKSTYSMLPCVYQNVTAPMVTMPPVASSAAAAAATSHGQPISRTTAMAPAGMTTTHVVPQHHTATHQRIAHGTVDVKPDIKVLNMQRAQLIQTQTRPLQQHQQLSTVRQVHTHIRIQTPQQQQTHLQQQHQVQLQQQLQQQQQHQQHPNMPQYKTITNTKWIAASTADSRHQANNMVAHSSTSHTPATKITTIKPVVSHTTLQRQPATSGGQSTSYTVATSAPIKTVSNGSAMYSVMYAGTGNKITIKRKTDTPSGAQTAHFNTSPLNPAATALRRMAATATSTPMQSQQSQQIQTTTMLNRPATVSPLYKDQKLPATLLTSTTATTTTVSGLSGQPATIRYQKLPSQQQQLPQQQQHHFNPTMMQHAPLLHSVQLQQQHFKKPVPACSRTITTTNIAATTTVAIKPLPPASSTTPNTILSTTPSIIPATNASAAAKRKGCRCGNATPTPGKLTCCGQRCPCYVDAKSCVDCKCRGCRNPHRADGFKIRPHIPELDCIDMLADTDGSTVLRSVMAPVAASTTTTTSNVIGGGSVTAVIPMPMAIGTAVSMATVNRLTTSSSSGPTPVTVQANPHRISTSFLTTPSSGTISLDASSLHGLSLDQDSIIFNPNDLDDVVNVYTTHQMPSSTLNYTTLPTTILMQDSATVGPSKIATASIPTSTTSFFSTILASTGGKPQTKLLASVAGEVAVDDDDDDDDDDEDDDEDDDDEDDGEEEDDDVNDVSYVPENDIGRKHLVQMETGTSVSYHIDGPDGDEHQLSQFEHILDDAQLSSQLCGPDEVQHTPGVVVVAQQRADEEEDDDDDDEDDDDDDVEDDDEDDEDFSMSDEPSDLDIDI